jgi:hypothetical protein
MWEWPEIYSAQNKTAKVLSLGGFAFVKIAA